MEPEISEDREVIISVSVICKDAHLLTKASEVLSRAAMGLALEGLMVSMNMAKLDPEQEGIENS